MKASLVYCALTGMVATAAGQQLQIVTTIDNSASQSVWGNESSLVSQVGSGLQNIENNNPPAVSTVAAALSAIDNIYSNNVPDIVMASQDNLQKSLMSKSVLDILNGYSSTSIDSYNNTGNPAPGQTIYPKKSSSDAPYSLTQQELQDAIYIPSSFGYGANGKKPVILIPGTACPAGMTYYFSFENLGQAANADPVWVNVPGASLGDAQVNAEYVAYAMNYISAVSSGASVSIISWSQGGPDTQWALKYWPSTQGVLEDFIAISPDFHGTVNANFLCPGIDSQLSCTPSIWQQRYDANFISVLRSNGGDSAYVPTTTIYSSTDQIVEPQSGTNASAYMLDTRGVGVTNNEVQTVCAGQLAGGTYTHEGVLYNSLAWALAVDALNNPGPGEPSRINLSQVCSQSIAPELNLEDVLGTEGLLFVAVAEIGQYQPKTSSEPPTASYA